MNLLQAKKGKTRHNKIKGLYYCYSKEDKGIIIKKEFELSLMRSVWERVDRGFIKTYKPIIDDAPYRFFNRIEDYKNWCNKKLPGWMGYGKAE